MYGPNCDFPIAALDEIVQVPDMEPTKMAESSRTPKGIMFDRNVNKIEGHRKPVHRVRTFVPISSQNKLHQKMRFDRGSHAKAASFIYGGDNFLKA